MTIHSAHVHAARKPEDSEARTEHMVTVFKNGEPKMELSRKRRRARGRVGAYTHHLAAGSLDCIQLSLQLHELLLTGASSASFIEVDDHLGAAEIGQ